MSIGAQISLDAFTLHLLLIAKKDGSLILPASSSLLTCSITRSLNAYRAYIKFDKKRDQKVGWVERSETQHQPSSLLGFVASTQPTHDPVFIMGNQLDMILQLF